MFDYIPTIAKAIAAAATTFGGTFVTAMDGGVTNEEWAVVAAATVAAFFTVWATPNAEA